MGARLRSWRQKSRKPLTVTGIIALLVVAVVLIWASYAFKWSGAGFSNKTVWDWLNLLAVLAIPVAVTLGTAWFTTKQGQLVDAENKDNQHEAALQTYLDKMSELLLHENLRESTQDEEVRKIARVRTLTVLRRIDGERKASVLLFLYESDLINKHKPIINLEDADLSKANLIVANLSEADLSKAQLFKADLNSANLNSANLHESNLTRAILFRADLHGANLHGASLFGAELRGADLTGADLSEADLSEPT